jgi:hypothetical protein
MKEYYVYALLDSTKKGIYEYGDDLYFEYEPFYIGKGIKDRIKTTLYSKEGAFKNNKIKKITRNGGTVIVIKLFENLENEESYTLESLIIKKIGRRDLKIGPLVNKTDGGDGRRNPITTEETKRKISKTKKEQALSIPHTTETKKFLREINKGEKNPMWGKTHSDEIKETQSLRVSGLNHPMYGKKHNIETIDKIKKSRNSAIDQEKMNELSRLINSKSVIQYTLDGEFVAEYSSIKEASEKTGLSESLIGKTCRGVVKNPRKFIFKFSKDTDKVFKNSYLYKVGDSFIFDNKEYILIKRSKKSVIAKIDEQDLTIRRNQVPFLWDKKVI